jgi:hypothetical protein
MTPDEYIQIANTALIAGGKNRLSESFAMILRGVSARQSYGEVATLEYKSESTIKGQASSLWKLLSSVLGEPISQNNILSALEQYQPQQTVIKPLTLSSTRRLNLSTYNPKTWTGRETIAQPLIDKLQTDCRLVVITGLTGSGKTTLAERIAAELQPVRYDRVEFDRGEDRDFARGAATMLEKMGVKIETEERSQPQILLNKLIQQLATADYWLQLDSVEYLIDTATGTFSDPLWVDFWVEFIKLDHCASKIVITSQVKPVDLTERLEQSDHYWHHQALSGLPADEWLELFKNYGVSSAATADREILTQIADFYAGHIYVLQMIAGEILAAPVSGEIAKYWRKYQAEFAGNMGTIQPSGAINCDELEKRIKRRVKISLAQLPELAQTLIKRSSIYRQAVPAQFWLLLIADIERNPELELIRLIGSRYLLASSLGDDGEVYLHQHNLIRQVANELLRVDREEWHKTETKATGIWLQLYKVPAVPASKLEILRGQLEAFYHAVNIEAWDLAAGILLSNEFSQTGRSVSHQLSVWGYDRDRIALHQSLGDRALEIAIELGIPLVENCQKLKAELEKNSPIY